MVQDTRHIHSIHKLRCGRLLSSFAPVVCRLWCWACWQGYLRPYFLFSSSSGTGKTIRLSDDDDDLEMTKSGSNITDKIKLHQAIKLVLNALTKLSLREIAFQYPLTREDPQERSNLFALDMS